MKGIKYGGYLRALWKDDSQYKSDSSAFLFNFNNKKIFNNTKSNESIYCSDNACFGNYNHSDFFIRNRFLTNKIFENRNKYGYNSNGFDVQGENDAKIKELEIYKCNI